MRRLPIVVLVVFVACGDSPTAPSAPQIPQVAGTYTGTLMWRDDFGPDERGSGRLVVTQADATVTIAGSLTFFGLTQEIAAANGTIDATGFFTMTGGGFHGIEDPECGRYISGAFSIVFSGRTLQLVQRIGTDYCGTVEISGTLSR